MLLLRCVHVARRDAAYAHALTLSARLRPRRLYSQMQWTAQRELIIKRSADVRYIDARPRVLKAPAPELTTLTVGELRAHPTWKYEK